MQFIRINQENWGRREHFAHYMQNNPCSFCATVELDINRLYQKVKNEKISLYAALIYGITRVVNRHPEMRMDLDEAGEPGYYQMLYPSYTVFHQETKTFSCMWTPYHEDFTEFYRLYQQDKRDYGDCLQMQPKTPPGPFLLNISCIPWMNFTSFQLNIQNGYDYLLPIITIGKYRPNNGQLLLPVSMQIHHAACDGYHASLFFQELQQWIDTL